MAPTRGHLSGTLVSNTGPSWPSCLSDHYTPGIRSMQWGYVVFVVSVCQSVNIYFVSKISQELLHLET